MITILRSIPLNTTDAPRSTDVSSLNRTNPNSGGRSYMMSSLKNKGKLSGLRSKERGEGSRWNNQSDGPFVNSSATVQAGRQRDEDALSDNSQRAIVMKQTIDVTHEGEYGR